MCRRSLFFVCFVVAVGLTLTHPAQAELVGWWRFDEGSGTTVNDSSGNDHHGGVHGTPGWGDGPDGFGLAMDFSQTLMERRFRKTRDLSLGVRCGKSHLLPTQNRLPFSTHRAQFRSDPRR